MNARKTQIIARMLLRVSSQQQTNADGDLPTQRSLVRAYIAKKPEWTLDDEKPEYFEGGVSGFKNSVSDRKVLQEILQDAKKREFDILVCYKDDRLGRREDEIPQYIKKLAEYSVLIYTVKDGRITPETHTDNLLTYIRYWHAEGSSRDTGLRVRDAAIELVRQGKNQGGNAPFGYELVYSGELNKHHRALKKKSIVPEKAEIVKQMYQLALTRGYGACKITKILNADEKLRTLSPNGAEWKAITVGDILKNPIYTGYEAYNRRSHEGDHFKRLDREHWILSESCNEELAVIDLDTWETVQRIRENRKAKYSRSRSDDRAGNAPANTTGRLALIDVAYCGCCGRKLTNGSKYNYWTTKSGEKKSSMAGYYRCPTRQQGGECSGRSVCRAGALERPVFAFVKEYLDFLEDNTAVIEKIKEGGRKRLYGKREAIRKLEKSLAEIRKDIAILKEGLPRVLCGEWELPVELFYEQIKEKERERREREEKLRKVKEETVQAVPFPARIPKWKDAFDHADVSAKRMIIGRLISRVDVKEEEISIQVRVNLDEFLSRTSICQLVSEPGLQLYDHHLHGL